MGRQILQSDTFFETNPIEVIGTSKLVNTSFTLSLLLGHHGHGPCSWGNIPLNETF